MHYDREREPVYVGVCVTTLYDGRDLCNDIHMLEASFPAVMWALVDADVVQQTVKPLCM